MENEHLLIAAIIDRTYKDLYIMEQRGVEAFRPTPAEKMVTKDGCIRFLKESPILKAYNLDFVALYEYWKKNT